MLSMIAAMGRNRVIGADGKLPWRLRDDLRIFKQTTLGHAVIMGRKTFDTLDKPLPGRMNIVLTRRTDFQVPAGVLVAAGPDEALDLCGDDPEPFIAGGGEIYRLFLPRADRIHLSIVDLETAGDATFPELDDSWHPVHTQAFPQDERNEASFIYAVYERRQMLGSGSISPTSPS